MFPIQRTVPAGEQTRYRKFIGLYQKKPVVQNLPDHVRVKAGYIIGKSLEGFKIAKLNKDDVDYILLGISKSNDYSQFHFGAGEASIIEIVTKIEASANESLVIVEEVENGLHPIATERMVEYFIEVSYRKKLQIIFSTHSEYALKCLPPEAIWACIDGEAYQGKLSIDSLRAITGSAEKDRVIFVEDEFAKDWLCDMLRQFDTKLFSSVEIHAAGGFPWVVDVTKHHNKNPSIKKKAVAVIDGDAPTKAEDIFLKLPGETPENEIYGFIHKNILQLSALVQQRCQCPNLTQDQIIKSVEKASSNSNNPHTLFRMAGEQLGFLSEVVVRQGMISIYNEKNKERTLELLEKLRTFIEA